MLIVKSDGRTEPFSAAYLSDHIEGLFAMGARLDPLALSAQLVAQKVHDGLYDGATTKHIDELAADVCASLTTTHPDYSFLGARILVDRLHRNTDDNFSQAVARLYMNRNSKSRKARPLVSKALYDVTMAHADRIDLAIQLWRDYDYTYFGFKTMYKSYLLQVDGKVIERPQYMLMRVALGIHGDDIDRAIETYSLMSRKYFTHASPTLFNAGTPINQMSSCFVVAMKEDSIEGIYDTLKTCAQISKAAGGIGLHVHNIRSKGSAVYGSNGRSSGLVPMLKVYNDTARYVDQGGNKRPGAFAIYVEPWHADIFDFLDLRKNHGKEEMRARDLFYALWIPDLFMNKVQANEQWCLFDPAEAPGLEEVYGEAFEKLYNQYEAENRFHSRVPAQKLWYAILEAQVETGNPFMLYKDACNRKSNQKNLGIIKSSNLCTEIVEYSSPEEVSVCNLASIALSAFVCSDQHSCWYDFGKLHAVVKVVVRNLNTIIDVNNYPVPEAQRSNLRHRPIAVGVQGLADTFMALRLPFESEQASRLNIQIFETIYHAAVEASSQLAKEQGPYETYSGSPASLGKLQFDLWDDGVKPTELWDWDSLKQRVAKNGLRNSLLVAPMPTASTSQILGLNECFEPYTSNMYTRRVLSGEFQVVNQWLLRDLIELGLWNDDVKNMLVAHGGSVQAIPGIPDDIKSLYKTVWEISQKTVIDMAVDRGHFIDQSQSLNIHIRNPTMGKLTSMHFYGWKKGLKTGMYYLRTQAASSPIKFTVDTEGLKRKMEENASLTSHALKRKSYLEADGAADTGSLSSSQSVTDVATPGTEPDATSERDTEGGNQETPRKRPRNDIYSDASLACPVTTGGGPDCEACSG